LSQENENKESDLDIKTIASLLQNSILVHVVNIENIKEKKNYALATVRIMVHSKDGAPKFGEIKLKLSNQALIKLQNEASRCSTKKKNLKQVLPPQE
jgi:hypothetical protein